MAETDKKLAVLIDAENISSKYVDIILKEANNIGNVIYKRIYGNWTSPVLAPWKNTIQDNAISPIQQFSNTNGKNSSDSALIIDAMDLLYQTKIDSFCIVSSDSDFTKLASRLRESEKYVVGMGEQKTPQSFISACNKFLYLDLLYDSQHTPVKQPGKEAKTAAEKTTASKKSRQAARKTPVIKKEPKLNGGKDLETVKSTLIKLAEEKSDEDGWIFSGVLGNLVSKQLPDFDVRNFGHSKFVAFVKSLDIFQVRSTTDLNNNSVKHVYFKLR